MSSPGPAERHYAQWAKGRQGRLTKLVIGTWDK